MTGRKKSFLGLRSLGGCQVSGLASVTRKVLPGAEVEAWHIGANKSGDDPKILAELKSFDVIISQLSDWDTNEQLRISRLREHGFPVTYLPTMVFRGFHPDISYIVSGDDLIQGVDGDYHSIIVAAAYSMELPETRVAGLFNSFIFAELGYFELFGAARDVLLKSFGQEGYDLHTPFDLWLQRAGQFMYTVNHPNILVLATLCGMALNKAGLSVAQDVTDLEKIDDTLASSLVWPVYPPLARRIGVAGSTNFHRGVHWLPEGSDRHMPLSSYISAAYAKYRELPIGTLRVGEVAVAYERLKSVVI